MNCCSDKAPMQAWSITTYITGTNFAIGRRKFSSILCIRSCRNIIDIRSIRSALCGFIYWDTRLLQGDSWDCRGAATFTKPINDWLGPEFQANHMRLRSFPYKVISETIALCSGAVQLKHKRSSSFLKIQVFARKEKSSRLSDGDEEASSVLFRKKDERISSEEKASDEIKGADLQGDKWRIEKKGGWCWSRNGYGEWSCNGYGK